MKCARNRFFWSHLDIDHEKTVTFFMAAWNRKTADSGPAGILSYDDDYIEAHEKCGPEKRKRLTQYL